MSWESYTAKGALKSGTVTTLGWEIIERQSHTVSPTAEFLFDNSKYEAFILRMSGVTITNAGGDFGFRVSVDGGATFLATNIYDRAGYSNNEAQATVESQQYIDQPRAVINNDGVTSSTNSPLTSTVEFMNNGPATRFMASSETMAARNGDGRIQRSTHGHGADGLVAPVDAVQFGANSGTLAGEFTLLGLPKVITTPVIHKPLPGWQTIETITASGAGSVEFGGIDQFNAIEIVGTGIFPSNDNTSLYAFVGENGVGGAYLANYQRVVWDNQTTGTGVTTSNSGSPLTEMLITRPASSPGMSNLATSQCFFKWSAGGIQLSNTRSMHTLSDCSYTNSSGGNHAVQHSGYRARTDTLTNIINAVKINPHAGTFTGKFTLLGLVQ